jgi:hypothetical protein
VQVAVRALAVVFGLVSAFFVFYTARLLLVTGFLQHTRAGGQGAYIGAAVFPALAVFLAWASYRAWRRGGPRSRGGDPS